MNVLKEWSFDFQNSKFTESQTLRSFLQAGDFILAENIKLIDVIKKLIAERTNC